MNQYLYLNQRLRNAFGGNSHKVLLVGISSLAGSGLLSIGLRFIGSIIQGRFVGPEILGYYAKFTILPGYLAFAQLGVFVSLARQYPYYIGKNDHQLAMSYAANALGWNNLICCLHVIIFLLLCTWSLAHGDWSSAMGWGSQVIIAPAAIYMSYLASTYRNNGEFVVWSKGSVVLSCTSLLFLPLVVMWQLLGVCVRYSLPNLISMLYLHWKRPLRIKARLNNRILRKMISFGAPLMVFTYIGASLWDSVMRTYVLNMIDERSLGIYAFSMTLCIALRTVATSISQVFHPRIASLYGSSNKDISAVFGYCLKCSMIGLLVMLPLVGLTYLIMGPLIRIYLPKYVECIPIAKLLCWWALIPVADLPSQLLIVAKRTKEYGASVLCGFILFVLCLGYSVFADRPPTFTTIVVFYVFCKLCRVIIADGFAWHCAIRAKGTGKS